MEDEHLFYIFFIFSMEDGRFFSVQLLSAVAEAPRPFGFLVSGAQRRAFTPSSAVADDEGVLLAVGAFYAPVF